MAFMKYFVPALAVASFASAIDCDDDTITIENSSDGEALASCTSIDGDVEISSHALDLINLAGVREIAGSLICNGGENVTDLSAPDLESIGNEFTLKGMSKLKSLTFDSLTSVGSIEFESLAHLSQLTFAKGVSEADSVMVTNTFLTSLSGIDLETVGDFYIANNIYLSTVNVNQITNITGDVDFSANHKNLEISFPNLKEAHNMTFRNASKVDLPSLESVSGGLGFYSSYFESFTGPNLTTVDSFLVFNDNSALTNISLPLLESVGGSFQIANNTELKEVTGVPKLETIEGALDFSGNFSDVALPALKDVRGAFNMQSSGMVDCDALSTDFEGDTVKGDWTCAAEVSNPGTEGSDPEDGTSGGGDEDAAALDRINIAYVVGFAGLVAAMLQ